MKVGDLGQAESRFRRQRLGSHGYPFLTLEAREAKVVVRHVPAEQSVYVSPSCSLTRSAPAIVFYLQFQRLKGGKAMARPR
jgi:hypothetical protein